MADMATPSAATMATVNAGADPVVPAAGSRVTGEKVEKAEKGEKSEKGEKTERTEKPEKPDEARYKGDLAQAEKEHAAVMERMVNPALPLLIEETTSDESRTPSKPRLSSRSRRPRTLPSSNGKRNSGLSSRRSGSNSKVSNRVVEVFRRRSALSMRP